MLFKALYDFSPEEPDELHLKVGDTIEVAEQVPGANWGVGKCQRTGQQGQFPWNYVEKIDTGDAAPPPIVPRRGSSAASSGAVTRGGHRYENVQTSPPARPGAVQVDLTKYPWFAADFDRQRAEDAMVDRPDGTFLVRPSKSHGGFSLSVVFDEIRHVMIMESQGKYGFSEPCTFNSVLELVEFFQRDSLACYNAELETKLVYPYKTAPKAAPKTAAEEDEDGEEDLYVSNRQALRMQRHRREDGATKIKLHDYGDIYEEIREDTIKHKAQIQIVMLLKEQRQLAEKISLRGVDHDKIRENRDMLKARLVDAERNLELLDGRLTAAKENYEKRKEAEAAQGGERRMGMSVRSGFREDIDRAAAEAMLEGKEDGCFVIRRSLTRTADPYTLSMRFEGETRHIQIKYDGTRYGLAEPLAFFTIQDFCDYYSTTPLSTKITKCLTVAINAL